MFTGFCFISATIAFGIVIILATGETSSSDLKFLGLYLILPWLVPLLVMWSWKASAERTIGAATTKAVGLASSFSSSLPFPAEAFADWLAFDGHLLLRLQSEPADPHTIAAAFAAIDPKANCTWIDERSLTVTLSRKKLQEDFHVGNYEAAMQVMTKLLPLIHQEAGIAQVDWISSRQA